MKLISILLIIISLNACGIYSFTGASIPPEAKTITVQYFNNKANTIHPELSQVFTERLKDMCLEQTNLTLKENTAELVFSGYISKYEIKPIAIKANETAEQNRLTIDVKVIYKNNLNFSNNFEQIFSRYHDYNSAENISDIEDELIEEITDELVEDVFNKAFVNW